MVLNNKQSLGNIHEWLRGYQQQLLWGNAPLFLQDMVHY